MKDTAEKITGYVWFDSMTGLYQKGSEEEFGNYLQLSGLQKEYSLILKLTSESDLLAHKIVKQLNIASREIAGPEQVAV